VSVAGLVDSHCHLDRFAPEERVAVIGRAREAGVGEIVTISTRLGALDELLGIARSSAPGMRVWCTVGTHPDHADEDPPLDGAAIASMAEAPEIVGIGESGLDFVLAGVDRVRQAKRFRAHIEAARLTGLPLVVHSRGADESMAALLREEHARGAFGFVMHCFSAGAELAATAIELGGYVSFSGILTFPKAASVREVAAWVPSDRILVETDAPFLAPVPHRGRQNEPAYVVHTAGVLADVLGRPEDEVAEQTTRNFRQLFRKAV
jgi:TatD DNase family protein